MHAHDPHVDGFRARLTAVGALSAGMLAAEISLTRLLGLVQFHHFAFLVVSLALLGLGAAGSLLAVRPDLARRPEWAAAGFSAACLAVPVLYDRLPFDSYAIAWDWRQVPNLVATLVVTALPFAMAGIVIAALLTAETARLHVVYGVNLGGSAVGSLASLALLSRWGPVPTLMLCAAVGLATVALLAAGHTVNRSRRVAAIAAAAALVLALTAVLRPDAVSVRLSPYKALSQALQAGDARHALSRWDTHGRIDVVDSASIHVLPGLSEQAAVPRPPLQSGLTIDADDLAPITALAPDDALAVEIADNVPEAVGNALRPAGRWLILDPGGGWPVLTALAGGARRVLAVEPSAAAARTVGSDYAAWTFGLYEDARVEVWVAEPRIALRRVVPGFDVVLLALRDAYRPVTSGAYSLGEDYGTTAEAVSDALAAAGPAGIVVVTRWLQTPPTESLRMLANMDLALRLRGHARPESHLAAFRSLRTMTFVAADRPLSETERRDIRAFVGKRGFDLVWLPDLGPEETNRHLRLPEPVYATAFAQYLNAPEATVRRVAFDVRPTRDNRPFFHHYFRWRQTPAVLAGLGSSWQPFGGSGYFVLVTLLAVATALAAAFVLLPLAIGRPARSGLGEALRSRRTALAYFAALGCGYMWVLLPLSQRAILYLGDAPRALAVVSASLLLFSGIGSLTARRWHPAAAAALVAVVVAAVPATVDPLWDATMAWSDAARLLLCVLSIAPIGLPIGVPFPAGIRRLETPSAGSTAWAWAVNACASVVAGVLAAMLALTWGFSAVLWCAAGAYAVATTVATRPTSRRLPAPAP